MCMVAMVAVSMVATVAAGVMQARAAQQAGQAQRKMNEYNARAAQTQAELAQRTATENISSIQEGAKLEAKDYARKVAAIEGEQKGLLAAQGYGGGSVTSVDIIGSTFDTALLDKAAIRYNADQKAWAIKNNTNAQVWDLNVKKDQFLMAGKNAATAGNMQAGASLLSTASQVGNQYMTYKYATK